MKNRHTITTLATLGLVGGLSTLAMAQQTAGEVGLNFIRFGSASVNANYDEPDEVFPDLVALGCDTIRHPMTFLVPTRLSVIPTAWG